MENKKTCKNCQQNFPIADDDFAFYQKIAVPPPTLCPDCRFQRRMSWRNDWHLFHKKEARTGKMIFSLFPDESPVKIYDYDYWWSDKWDPLDYGREYDFSRPFFEQFKELFHTVPLPAHSMFSMTDCRYCTNANNCKNCYLVRGASHTEDSAYLIWDQQSRQSFDSHMTNNCELSYGNVNTVKCFKTFFSVDCEDCTDVMFCKDCVGCTNCFGCVGLRNKSYMIFNKQYDKKEYVAEILKLNYGSFAAFAKLKEKAYQHWLTVPQKYIHGRQNTDVFGDYIYESKNAKHCYRVRGVEDSKYCANILTGPLKNCYDYANYGDNAEFIYESLVLGTGISNIKFSTQGLSNNRNVEYSVFFRNASDIFGCVSLRDKQYCILNKQYNRQDYENLVGKIKIQMTNAKEYGEFFPASLSPFPYKATASYEFFPLTEAEAKAQGFNWYETARQKYSVTMPSEQLPDDIKDATEDLLNQVVGCAHEEKCNDECTGAFRIIADELSFLKRMNLPLPRLCPNCRHYERLKLRNPPKFYERQCAKCSVAITTSYGPNRQEIVYCESCYQQEIV